MRRHCKFSQCSLFLLEDKKKEDFILKKMENKKMEEEGEILYKCRGLGCLRGFNRRDNLKRHEKTCKKVLDMDKILDDGEKMLEKVKMGKLKVGVEPLQVIQNFNQYNIHSGGKLVHKEQFIQQNLNQQNIININPFGLETPINFTDDFLNDVIKNPMKGIPDLIKMLHFNPEFPENQNIKSLGLNSPFIQTYDGDNWTLKEKEGVLQDLIVHNKEIADDYLDKVCYDDENISSSSTSSISKKKITPSSLKKMGSIKIKKYEDFSETIDRYVNYILNDLTDDEEFKKKYRSVYRKLCISVESMLINAKRLLDSKQKETEEKQTIQNNNNNETPLIQESKNI